MVLENLFYVISKDFRGNVGEKFFCSKLAEVSNFILIDFILLILLLLLKIVYNCYNLFQLYYWFKVKNKGLSQIYLITKYMILCMYVDDIYIYIYICIFVWTLIDIYMILDNMTMFWLWYPANGGYSLVCKVFLSSLMLTYMRDILIINLGGKKSSDRIRQRLLEIVFFFFFEILRVHLYVCIGFKLNWNYLWNFGFDWIMKMAEELCSNIWSLLYMCCCSLNLVFELLNC